MSPTHPINLTQIWGTHGSKQHLVTSLGIVRQIVSQKNQALGGSTTHQAGRNCGLHFSAAQHT
jgi:hypothetical protein